MSDEFLVKKNPQVILVSQNKFIGYAQKRSTLRKIEAIQENRIYVLDLSHHPKTPRHHWFILVEDIQILARLLHPEVFSRK